MTKKKTKKPATKSSKAKKTKKELLAEQSVIHAVDVNELEKQLPPKAKRSHHVVIKLEKVNKSFHTGVTKAHVLKDIDLNFYSGEFVIISGPSGSGKSTLLHTILGLEKPSSGDVFIRDENIYKDMNHDERAIYRREKIGMVFQQSNWIKSLNVLDNISYPLWLAGFTQEGAKQRATEALAEVGLEKWAKYHPNELSGGQQQRISLARALSTDPGIIIADEPTGNLDTKSSSAMMTLLAKLNREQRRMIVMVTHDVFLLPLATRRVVIQDGAIVQDEHD